MNRPLLPLSLFLIGCAPAFAADGALEINQDCALAGCFASDFAGFPVEIASSGTYVLTSDLTVPEFGAGIVLNASAGSITLDLQGHTMDGGGRCTGTPVTACTASAQTGIELTGLGAGRLTVRNGALRGFNRALFTSNHLGTTTLEDVEIGDTTELGFAAVDFGGNATSYVVLRRVTVARSRSGGIRTGAGMRTTLEDVAVVGNGGLGGLHAVAISGVGSLLRSRFVDNGGLGVFCTTCAFGANAFVNNNGGSANTQYVISTALDMGGNVCGDGTCP
jgi:hypothetical protein